MDFHKDKIPSFGEMQELHGGVTGLTLAERELCWKAWTHNEEVSVYDRSRALTLWFDADLENKHIKGVEWTLDQEKQWIDEVGFKRGACLDWRDREEYRLRYGLCKEEPGQDALAIWIMESPRVSEHWSMKGQQGETVMGRAVQWVLDHRAFGSHWMVHGLMNTSNERWREWVVSYLDEHYTAGDSLDSGEMEHVLGAWKAVKEKAMLASEWVGKESVPPKEQGTSVIRL